MLCDVNSFRPAMFNKNCSGNRILKFSLPHIIKVFFFSLTVCYESVILFSLRKFTLRM